MNGFGKNTVDNISARGFIHPGILNRFFPSPTDSVDYLIGMLVENNTYISKEITRELNDPSEVGLGTVYCLEKGPYIVSVGTHRKSSSDTQVVQIEFGFMHPVPIPMLSRNLSNYEVALYNHKTNKISEPTTLKRANQISIDECIHDPSPYISRVGNDYKVEDIDQPVAVSLIFFAVNKQKHEIELIVPSFIHL